MPLSIRSNYLVLKPIVGTPKSRGSTITFVINTLVNFVAISPNQLQTVFVFNVASWLLFCCCFFCFQDIKNHKNVCQTFLQLCELEQSQEK